MVHLISACIVGDCSAEQYPERSIARTTKASLKIIPAIQLRVAVADSAAIRVIGSWDDERPELSAITVRKSKRSISGNAFANREYMCLEYSKRRLVALQA